MVGVFNSAQDEICLFRLCEIITHIEHYTPPVCPCGAAWHRQQLWRAFSHALFLHLLSVLKGPERERERARALLPVAGKISCQHFLWKNGTNDDPVYF